MRSTREVLKRLGSVPIPSCHVLRSSRDVDSAVGIAKSLRLGASTERVKTWDNVLALRIIEAQTGALDEPIADLGCRSGILLTWLSQLGHSRLHGCDLRTPFPPVRTALKARHWKTAAAGVAMYAQQHERMIKAPVEDSGLPGGIFFAVTAMSVIEHGVDVPRFFAEAARLLRPGGTLIVSTDYWPTSIDMGGLRRFDVSRGSDRIFDRSAARGICDDARTAGFLAPATLELDADQPVVVSSGFSYTFLLLAFRRAN